MEKIAILGLANAGKTSIIRTVTAEFEGMLELKPTQNVERTEFDFLGSDLVLWDFGGQITYRKRYLDAPKRYFAGLSYLYFVVDIQDSTSIEESASYYNECVQKSIEFNDHFGICIFFHKFDPDYSGAVDLEKNKQRFLGSIDKEIISRLTSEPIHYKTSIYDPVTSVSVFSQALLKNRSIYVNIREIIEMNCLKNSISFSNLINHSELCIFKLPIKSLKRS